MNRVNSVVAATVLYIYINIHTNCGPHVVGVVGALALQLIDQRFDAQLW